MEMLKRGRPLLGFVQISILVLASFAISFLISENNIASAVDFPPGSNKGVVTGSNGEQIKKATSTSLLGASGTNNPQYVLSGVPRGGSIDLIHQGTKYTGLQSVENLENGGKLMKFSNGEVSVNAREFTAYQNDWASQGVGVQSEYVGKDPAGLFEVPGAWGHLYEGAIWSAAVVGAIQLIAPLLGADQDLTNTLSIAAVAGIMSFKGILALGPTGSGFLGPGNFLVANAGLIGVGVAVVVFVALYKKESKKVVQLECLPWEAPLGGADCEKCNTDPLKPCSEYRCKSLGQACDIVNKGTVEERCVWVSRNDVNSPLIDPWEEALTKGHKYTPDGAVRPPNRGVKIQSLTGAGCVKPFTPLEFGVQLNEPSQCKIDSEIGNKSFDEMQFFFGGSNFYRYNHTEKLRLPSPESIEAEGLEFPNEGLYNFYVRCRDANGNTNEDVFVFNFCVDKSPDTTPPLIEETSIRSGSPVTFGVQSLNVSIYVNEPTECRWSIQDKDYGSMENNMSCSTKVYEQNARQQYPCTTALTGLKDRSENNFYFRCKDKPSKPESERNVNRESYKFVLKGSQMLNILNSGPSGTLIGSTEVVPVNLTVRTDDGADEGKAICYFRPNGDESSFVTMFKTDSFAHQQILSLPAGNYRYDFRCVDAGGNAAYSNVSFNVSVDRIAPQASRLYKEGPDALVLVTNEAAECTYSLNSCNFVFNEGLDMKLLNINNRMIHAAEWKPNQALYIKCRDDYGNEPSPNACTVIASATSVI